MLPLSGVLALVGQAIQFLFCRLLECQKSSDCALKLGTGRCRVAQWKTGKPRS